MKLLPLTALAATLMFPARAMSQDAKPQAKPGAKSKAAPMITVPTFGALPKADGLVGRKSEKLSGGPKQGAADATYSVVRVQHAKAFTRTAEGSVPAPGAELSAVALTGEPPSTEKFTSVIRVRCPQRVGTRIDVVLLDRRQDTVMTATGELSFRQGQSDEAEYTIDWDPTPWPSGGEFQVLIRLAGQPMGTWPLRVDKR